MDNLEFAFQLGKIALCGYSVVSGGACLALSRLIALLLGSFRTHWHKKSYLKNIEKLYKIVI